MSDLMKLVEEGERLEAAVHGHTDAQNFFAARREADEWAGNNLPALLAAAERALDLEAKLAAAERQRDALAAALDGSKNCPKCHGFGYIDGDCAGMFYETDTAEERALAQMWRRQKCECRKQDPAAILNARDKERDAALVERLIELTHDTNPLSPDNQAMCESGLSYIRRRLEEWRDKAREGKL